MDKRKTDKATEVAATFTLFEWVVKFKEKYGRPSTNDEQELMRIYSEQYYMGVIGVIGTGLTLLNAK